MYENKKFKARLIIKGYSQKEDVDYCETFSPVVNYASLRYLFSLAIKENLMVNMDVTMTYLQGNIDEEIYFEPPSLFEEKNNKEEKGKV